MIPANARLESVTISWLPENLIVRTFALCAEPGANLRLHDTLRFVLDDCQRVSLWGPYQIDPELYCLAVRQKNKLDSGQVRYKANDAFRDTARVSNCIHALSNVVTGPRLRVASPGWGETASYAILRRYMPYISDCNQTHSWLVYALGVDAYPIIYRDFRRPYSGFVGPAYRLFGGERSLQPTYGPPR